MLDRREYQATGGRRGSNSGQRLCSNAGKLPPGLSGMDVVVIWPAVFVAPYFDPVRQAHLAPMVSHGMVNTTRSVISHCNLVLDGIVVSPCSGVGSRSGLGWR